VRELTEELQEVRAELARRSARPDGLPPPAPSSQPPGAKALPEQSAPPPGRRERATPFGRGKESPSPAAPHLPEAEGHAASPGSQPAGQDFHTELCRRLAEIEQDRRGRWQKILDLVRGK